jgi:hypothetical protein
MKLTDVLATKSEFADLITLSRTPTMAVDREVWGFSRPALLSHQERPAL